MASVTTMIVVFDNPQTNGKRSVRYKFDLLDNLNQNHIVYYGPKQIESDIDTDEDMLEIAPTILAGKLDYEQRELQDGSRNNKIVLQNDLGGYYEHKTLRWDTWENHTTAWLKYWLALEDQLELYWTRLDLIILTNTELKDLLGIAQGDTADIRAAVQIAIDTRTTLDTYVPFYDDNGDWVGV